MRRATYGDRILEIPINHTKDCLLYRNNSLRAPFKYKLILGTGAQVVRFARASTMRCVGVPVPAPTSVRICTGRVKHEARPNLRQRYTICASHVLCIRKLAATVYTNIPVRVCAFWLVDSSIYYIYIYMYTRWQLDCAIAFCRGTNRVHDAMISLYDIRYSIFLLDVFRDRNFDWFNKLDKESFGKLFRYMFEILKID